MQGFPAGFALTFLGFFFFGVMAICLAWVENNDSPFGQKVFAFCATFFGSCSLVCWASLLIRAVMAYFAMGE